MISGSDSAAFGPSPCLAYSPETPTCSGATALATFHDGASLAIYIISLLIDSYPGHLMACYAMFRIPLWVPASIFGGPSHLSHELAIGEHLLIFQEH